MNKIKLFCFPYAGGSSSIYLKWKPFLAEFIDLHPVELAGRGRRINEALYRDVPAAIDDVFNFVVGELRHPYAFFGHSMGAMIAYELAQKIRRMTLPSPMHIFVSGRRPPHSPRLDDKVYHRMEPETFRKEVLSLGGTPPELFQYPELADLYLPLLKNDFKLAETNCCDKPIEPLDCKMSGLFGKEDELAPEAEGWQVHTKAAYSLHHFEGGHFFIQDQMPAVVSCINNTLRQEITQG
jgi:surfactin synthase thioesterase subunit